MDLEFQLLKTLEVDIIRSLVDTNKIKATLKGEMLNNEDYLGTITFMENSKLEKIEISKGINYFKTGELAKYEGPTEEELLEEADLNTDMSLEEELMKALDKSGEGDSEINSDLKDELNSAAEDPANVEQTQLEKLALSQKETPDTGAETWVLLLATFIINTFYFISRRKKISIV
ncbi:MAG: hypothetical protein Q9M97_01715 [Candidatus Gracilibacteria bacterium]|nr:hypothetical protein [Candidatus Gracilibacteria bacterium]